MSTVQFFVDKTNKVPLYLQLTDEIKFYISTGALGENEQLPPVKALAKTLGINFLTVRKAYKELENAGLLDIRHGEGTFISLNNEVSSLNGRKGPQAGPANRDASRDLAEAVRSLFDLHLKKGLSVGEMGNIVGEVLSTIERKENLPFVVFAECNQFQIDSISTVLRQELGLDVEPVLIADLKRRLPEWLKDSRELHIVTTGFYTDLVRKAIGDLPIKIEVLITNLDPATRRKIEAIGENASYAFICRDKESAAVYKDLLEADLGYKPVQLVTCTLAETWRVRDVIDDSDVLLVSPQVYEEVKRLVPAGKAMFNVFDRVDPVSLKVVKDRILGGRGT
jgi:DNA-binding transcriptional regulator YhcF (GntR family)